jgi:small subunit ribosomal protein S11
MARLKKKQKKSVTIGVASVKTTFNNTIITISDILGNTVCWASAGSSGFKGARKLHRLQLRLRQEVLR